jgi:hypothetical protein
LLAAAVLGTSSPSNAVAAPIACTPAALATAIELANGAPGPDTIDLPAGCTYTYTVPYSSGSSDYDFWYGPSALPAIASNVTIEGNGATIARAAAPTVPFRLFFVGADPADPDTFNYATPGAGSLTLRELTLRDGLARGGDSLTGGGAAGMGGAIFNQGQVTLERTTIATSTAQGGSGGVSGLGGGGGGIGADAVGAAGSGFGTGFSAGGAVSSGGSGAPDGGGGGGGGFRPLENGSSASATTGANGGGPSTGLGGKGGPLVAVADGGLGGNGSGGGGATQSGVAAVGGNGGGFGSGGVGGGNDGGGGGGGVGGGGGALGATGGGGGFAAGGGRGGKGGGVGGFGGGGGGAPTGFPSGAGGFAGGSGGTAAGGGGAGLGGAIFNHQGELTIQNSTLSGNSAIGGSGAQNGSGLGGSIFNLNGTLALDSLTIAFNTAEGGGAIYNLGYLAADSGAPLTTYSAGVTLTNSILSDSVAAASDLFANSPTVVSGGSSNTAPSAAGASDQDVVESRGTGGSATITGAPVTADPLLGPLAANGGTTFTHAITTVSPAFETGQTSLLTDQRGVSRPQGAADDIGAFELAANVTVTPPATTTPPATATTPADTGQQAAALKKCKKKKGKARKKCKKKALKLPV